MRVLQIVPSYYPAFVYGGPIFSIHFACQALARQGVEIAVATTNANGAGKLDVLSREPVAFEPNYLVRYYDDTFINRFSWDFTRYLWRDLKSAHVLHLHDVFSTYAAWALILAGLARKPILVAPRGSFTTWGLRSKRPWLKKLWIAFFVRPFVNDWKRVAWHATSEVERDEILVQFPKARVFVALNGIDRAVFDRVSPVSRLDYLARFFPGVDVVRERATVLTALGRLHPVKGFDIAIKAFQQIAQALPDSVLLIAGGDEGMRGSLEELIAECGLEKRVSLVGEVTGSDKIVFLKGSDLFLFPSHSENFGMAALEALVAGVPVVASRNTPWRALEEEGSGRWAENTTEAFARAITDLLAQDHAVLSARARKHAAQYDVAAMAAQLEEIYSDLIKTSARVEDNIDPRVSVPLFRWIKKLTHNRPSK